jgi:nucleoside phosphorylase
MFLMDKHTNHAYELDFVVVSTLDEEFRAVKKVFGLQKEDLRHKEGLRYYYKEIEGFRVGFYQFHQRENPPSATGTRQIIDILKPRFIILAGIAGGIREYISLGDVAVSDDVEYYPYKKVDDKEGGPRHTTVAPPSKELNEIIRHVGVEWEKRVSVKRPEEGVTRIIRGLYLSGEEILGGGEEARGRVQELENRYGKFIAVENEAGGVAEAVYGSSSEYIVIKGISDYAGESGSQQQRDKWRDYASHTSAALSYELILTMAKVSPYSELLKVRGMLRGYLEEAKKEFEKKSLIDGKSLSEYYVESSFKLTKGDTWNKKDWEVDGKEWEIEDFLKDPKRWYIVIGAPFGSGKTSFVKHLGKKLAENLLKNMNDYNQYFPILVKLREADDIKSYGVYEQKNLEALLKHIRAENERRRVLLILDGLDEHKEIMDLFNYIAWLNNEYGIRVIVTSRLVEIPKQYIEEYVRLMPFDKEKVNEFFKRYKVDLDYDRCKELGLGYEEISNPLFCWILGIVWSSHKIVFLPRWSSEMKKSLLYYIFMHSLIKGKHKKEVEEFKRYYPIEKEVLRCTAAMMNMLNELDEDQLKSKLKEMEIKNLSKVDDLEKYLEPVLTSYFYRSPDEMVSRRIDFIHKSFKEYLLAEYYYESIKSGKMHRLNVGLPSMETMEFLKGLIEISNNAEAKETLKQVEGEPPTIFEEVDKIAENAKRFLEDESLILASPIRDEECWKIAHPDHINYEHIWMYRWISLYTLKWIKPEEKIGIKKIERMIKLTSHNIPRYLKVLKEAYLVGADLSRADLSEADLSRAKLFWANLSEADLSEAKLSRANLSEADLSRAKLSRAIFFRANLFRANLFRADLSGADLSRADLSGADLSEADLEDAKTKYAVVNEETKAMGIVLVPKYAENKTSLKKALKAVDPSLRKIILRDNPNLRELLH